MTYKQELNKLRSQFKTDNEMLSSELYKNEYPKLKELYKKEGLKEKRKTFLKNRRKLKQLGFNALFISK